MIGHWHKRQLFWIRAIPQQTESPLFLSTSQCHGHTGAATEHYFSTTSLLVPKASSQNGPARCCDEGGIQFQHVATQLALERLHHKLLYRPLCFGYRKALRVANPRKTLPPVTPVHDEISLPEIWHCALSAIKHQKESFKLLLHSQVNQ